MCCEKRLRLGGSVQLRGWWVPSLTARVEAEAEGRLLVGC